MDPQLAQQALADALGEDGLTLLVVATRHPQDYVLTNEQDNTRWRGTATSKWSDLKAHLAPGEQEADMGELNLTLQQAQSLLDALDIGLDSSMYEAENANGSHDDAAKINAAIAMLGQLIDAARKDQGGGNAPVQDLRPCRSPYCECEPGKCTHPGCYDARGAKGPEHG